MIYLILILIACICFLIGYLVGSKKEPPIKADKFEKQLDEIFDKAALEPKFEERKKLYDEYQQIIYDERPVIYLYSPTRIVAIRKKFKNIFPSKLSGITYNIEEIYEDKR